MYEWDVVEVDKKAADIAKLLNDREADGWQAADMPWHVGARRLEGDTWVESLLVPFVREKVVAAESAEVAPPEDAQAPAHLGPHDVVLFHLDAAYRALGTLPQVTDMQIATNRGWLDKILQGLRGDVLKAIGEGRL